MKTLISTFAFAVLATIIAPAVNAQDGGVVAVLDVAKVFKVNQEFDNAMKDIKAEAEGLKAEIQQRQEAIKQEAQQVAGIPQNSPDRNDAEVAVEQKQTALRTWARQQETRLLNKEAQVYYNTYLTMKRVVGDLAAQYNISLVVRFDGSAVSSTNRPEVIKAVNRSVVYHRDIDLTNMVINGMGPRVADAGGAGENR